MLPEPSNNPSNNLHNPRATESPNTQIPVKSEIYNLIAPHGEPASILVKNLSANVLTTIISFMGYSLSEEFVSHIVNAVASPESFDPQALKDLYVSHNDLPLTVERTQILKVGNGIYHYTPSLMQILLEDGTYKDAMLHLNPAAKECLPNVNLTIDFSLAEPSTTEAWTLIKSIASEVIEGTIDLTKIDTAEHKITREEGGVVIGTISNCLSIVVTPMSNQPEKAASTQPDIKQPSKARSIIDSMKEDLSLRPNITKQSKIIPVGIELEDVSPDKWCEIFKALKCSTLSNEGRAIIPYLVSITEGMEEFNGKSAENIKDKLPEKLDIRIVSNVSFGEDEELSDLGIDETEEDHDQEFFLENQEILREAEEEYTDGGLYMERSSVNDDNISGAQISVIGSTCIFADLNIYINRYPISDCDYEYDFLRNSIVDGEAQNVIDTKIDYTSFVQIYFSPNGQSNSQKNNMAWAAIDNICRILGEKPISVKIKEEGPDKLPATDKLFGALNGKVLVLLEREQFSS